jgi:hypothetical protein
MMTRLRQDQQRRQRNEYIAAGNDAVASCTKVAEGVHVDEVIFNNPLVCTVALTICTMFSK